jgi:hypothetical protein
LLRKLRHSRQERRNDSERLQATQGSYNLQNFLPFVERPSEPDYTKEKKMSFVVQLASTTTLDNDAIARTAERQP